MASLVAAACGDDEDTDSATEETGATGDTSAYCDVARELAEGAPTEEQLAAAGELAPEEIADDVAFVVDALIERGPAAFGDSDIQERLAPVAEYEEQVCGIEPSAAGALPEGVTTELDPDAEEVAVSAVDHAFEFEPPRPGPVSFVLTNDGEEPHELIIVKPYEGVLDQVTLEEFLDAPPETDDAELEAASDLAEPGEQVVLSFENLEAGEYVMACFVPSDDGTPHAFLGMATTFTVE